MPIQTFVTHLRALSPAHTLTQSQTLAWLVEAHTRAERTLSMRNGSQFEEDQPPSDLLHVTCTGYASPSAAQSLVSKRGGGATRALPTRITWVPTPHYLRSASPRVLLQPPTRCDL